MGTGYITDYIGTVKYRISPLSFYQVNPAQTEKLYGLALEYADLTGNETVWDLYCGIGTISLFLAQKAKKVYGVEIVPEAIADAKNNAKINEIENAEFFVGKSEEILPAYYEQYAKDHPGEHAHADVIVVDPPRKGCEENLLHTMASMQPDRIVYVSCDSATLARDVKVLGELGYEVKKVRGVDQFPMTCHVECVVALHRGRYVRILDLREGNEESSEEITGCKASVYAEFDDCPRVGKFVKLLDFRHFERHMMFSQSDRKTYKKAISDGVNVSVVLDVGCGNT